MTAGKPNKQHVFLFSHLSGHTEMTSALCDVLGFCKCQLHKQPEQLWRDCEPPPGAPNLVLIKTRI